MTLLGVIHVAVNQDIMDGFHIQDALILMNVLGMTLVCIPTQR